MAIQFSNLASTTLASGVSSTATSVSVTSASSFPTLGSGDYFYATIGAGSGSEIVKVTAISGTTFTVVRGEDGTTAVSHSAGFDVALRVTAGTLEDLRDGGQVYTAGSGLGLSGNEFTNTAPDQTVSISGSGSTTVTGTYPSFTVSSTSYSHPSAHPISFITGLQTALDGKVDDSQVLTNVPSGALFTDTNTVYTHPSAHAISFITGLQTALDGKVDDSQVLTNVPSGALFTDTVYTLPFTDNSANWNTAYGWGDHASGGYLTSHQSLSGYATETYVGNQITALVDSSPATMDTLNELAAALGDDPNFATTVSTSIGTKWTQDNTKISQWNTAYGWGNHASAGYLTSYTDTNTTYSIQDGELSQNNFTNADHTKLNGIATGANNYTLPFTNNSANWNTAYGWGNHASAGYLTSYTDTNTTYSAGTGISLSGTTFSLTDTNAKLNLSGGTLTGKLGLGVAANTTNFLRIARQTGHPNIKSSDPYLLMDSNGSQVGLNWYSSDNVSIAGGGGAVHIGGTSPSERLQVNGNLRVDGALKISSTTVIDSSRNITAGTISSGAQTLVASATIIESLRNPSTSWGEYALTRYGTEGANFRFMDFGYYRGTSEATRGLVIKSQAFATLFTFLDSGEFQIGTTTVIDSSRNLTNIGSISASYAGGSSTANLNITNTASSAFNHSLNAFAPNMTAGEANILVVGRAGSTKNSGYIGYTYSSAGSNDNYLTFGHWASDHLLRLHGDGKLNLQTGYLQLGGTTVIDSSRNLTNIGTISNPSIWINDGTSTASWNENIRLYDTSQGVSTIAFGAAAGSSSGTPRHSFVSYSGNLSFYYGSSLQEYKYNGYSLHTGSYRAPIFYDSNNTNFYVSPDSTSNLNRLNVDSLGGHVNAAYFDIEVNGDANTYYPVSISSAGSYGFQMYSVSRGYNWTAPTTWNTASHKGGLTFSFQWAGDGAWGGNDKTMRITQFQENYTTMVAGMQLSTGGGGTHAGPVIWLRGGGAQYRIHHPAGVEGSANIHLTSVTASNGTVYAPRSNTSNNTSEIYGRYPVRGTSNLHVGSFAVLHEGADQTKAGYLQSNASLRAPIFYDSNNTGYYVNPASTSILVSATFDGNITVGNASTSSYITMGDSDQGARSIHCNSDRIGFLNQAGSWGAYCADSGDWYSNFSSRAPIFYDSNDTNYYVDPTSTGTSLRIQGDILCDHNYGKGFVGKYSASRLQHVFSMGAAYRIAADGTGAGNMYGMAWSHPNAGGIGGANNLNDHGLLIINNGSFRAAISSRAVFSADVRGTKFYDYNNTGYYVDPNGTSNFNGAGFEGGTSFFSDSYFYSNRGGYSGTLTSPALQAYATSSNSAFMSFHRAGGYAVNMGLDVDNVLRIGGWSASANRFQMDMSGNLTMSGNVTAYSDARLKENVEVIPDAVAKIQKLRGVTFTRNDTDDLEKRHAGVIAQEVEAVLPEVVSEDNNGIKNVAYGNMVGLLIEAIKELKSEIDDLKTQLAQKEQ